MLDLAEVPLAVVRVLVLEDRVTGEHVYRYVTEENEAAIGHEVVAGPYRLLLSIEADAVGLLIDRRQRSERRLAGS